MSTYDVDLFCEIVVFTRFFTVPANSHCHDAIVVNVLVTFSESCGKSIGLFGLSLDETKDRSAKLIRDSRTNLR